MRSPVGALRSLNPAQPTYSPQYRLGFALLLLHCGNSSLGDIYTEVPMASQRVDASRPAPPSPVSFDVPQTRSLSDAGTSRFNSEQPNFSRTPSSPSTTTASTAADAATPAPKQTQDAGVPEPEPAPPSDPCSLPPDPEPLVGWAATPGRGLATTTGGGQAEPVRVSTLEQLAAAVQGDTPRVVHILGVLEPGNLRMGSNKTLEGICGAEFHGHLEIREAQNVIIRNLTIVGYAQGDCALDPGFDAEEGCSSGADAVTVQRDSHHIWFDHCSVRDGADGNLDISNGADFVTISWTKFSYTPRSDFAGNDSTGASGHRYSNLVGGTNNPNNFDDENALNVTWHHNWWADNVVERQPRVRFGRNHLFNNLYDSLTTNYCVRAGRGARVLLEGNHFVGVDDPHEFNNNADQATAFITADNSNRYDNTTSDRAVGGGGEPFVQPPYPYELEAVDTVLGNVRVGAGPH